MAAATAAVAGVDPTDAGVVSAAAADHDDDENDPQTGVLTTVVEAHCFSPRLSFHSS